MDPPRWPQFEIMVVETGLMFEGRQLFLQAGQGGYYDSDLVERLRDMLKGIAIHGTNFEETGG